ncbi:hypothetical protein [Halosimplex amylolyticum]|uniref:hypothetical protein n=1 Tax=Halosimplex amylolyticum TaxID=3396616 RepID=UPI003F57BE25
MPEIGDAFDALMDPEVYTQAAAGFAGYAGAEVAQNLIEPHFDAPDEAYGLVVVGTTAAVDVPYGTAIGIGGGAHTVEAAAERVGVRETIVNIGGN